jgi:hypothetical protein
VVRAVLGQRAAAIALTGLVDPWPYAAVADELLGLEKRAVRRGAARNKAV